MSSLYAFIGLICTNGSLLRLGRKPFVSVASHGCQQKHARLTRPDRYPTRIIIGIPLYDTVL